MLKKFSLLLCGIIVAGSINVSAAQKINVNLNGEYIDFDNANPVVKDNRTLIPLRGLFEKMGYTIGWEPKTKAAEISKDGNKIVIRSNKDYITINNIQKKVDVPAQIIDGWMMIPLRAVADATGANVTWDANTKTVGIQTDKELEYALELNSYAKKYSAIVAELDYLDEVAAQLNTLNSDDTRANVKRTQEMLEEAKTRVISVINDIEDLKPNSKFKEYNELSLEAAHVLLDLIDTLDKAVSGNMEYDKATAKINSILEHSKALNMQISKLSL